MDWDQLALRLPAVVVMALAVRHQAAHPEHQRLPVEEKAALYVAELLRSRIGHELCTWPSYDQDTLSEALAAPWPQAQ